MIYKFLPKIENYWYLNENKPNILKKDSAYDVVIIGGGMAGLSAAQSFRARGLSVALLEKNFCGSGASGKSSGFINADAEISLSGFVNMFGPEKAKKAWEFGINGVEIIRNNIKEYSLNCDYIKYNTLVLADSTKKFASDLVGNNKYYNQLGFKSNLYSKEEQQKLINSNKYYGALEYLDTFGINAYLYCKSLKKVLLDLGIDIYEETPVIEVKNNIVITPDAKVKAKHIIFCVDRFLPKFDMLEQNIYQTQAFLALSSPLSDAQVSKIFPKDLYMCWDTKLTYNYFRLVKDNRLLIGGTSILDIYSNKEDYNNRRVFKDLVNYIKFQFPQINITFEYFWPGLIGVTKDIVPIAGPDKNNPSVYYISGAAGLPWAAALGEYSAKKLIDNISEYDKFFDPYRKFPIGGFVQSIIGKRLSFALSNYMSLNQFV